LSEIADRWRRPKFIEAISIWVDFVSWIDPIISDFRQAMPTVRFLAAQGLEARVFLGSAP
jgi:hypothetical protein